MKITKKIILPIIGVTVAFVAALQIFLYEATIQIAQAKFDSIPLQLSMEIILTIAAHAALILIAPLILATFNKITTSYLALILLASVYIQTTTGMNAIGPTIGIIVFSALIFYAYMKARELIQYFRAK
jgi:hypothetical protein